MSTTTKESQQQQEREKQLSGLEKELAERNINFAEFKTASEERRKKLLGEDYSTVKTANQWVYDQPILNEEEKKAVEDKEAEDKAAAEAIEKVRASRQQASNKTSQQQQTAQAKRS